MLWIFRYLKQQKGLIALACMFLFLQMLGTLTIPTLTANIINYGVAAGNISYIIKTGGMMVLCALLSGLCAVAGAYLSSKLASITGRELRVELFTKAQRLSPEDFDTVGSSSMITRSTGDIVQIQQAVLFVFQFLLPVPFMVLSGLILGFTRDSTLTGLLVALMMIYIVYGYLIGRRMIPITRQMQVKMDRINRTLLERLSGVRVIRAFNRTGYEQEKLTDAASDYAGTAISLNKVYAVTYGFIMLTMNMIIVLFLWLGGARIAVNAARVGDIMAFIEYATLILSTLNMGIMTVIFMFRAQASVERVCEVLQKQEPVQSGQADNPDFDAPAGTLTFDNVSFGYNGAQELVLKNISFTAKKGQTTAVIGGTGSGKSTLLKLIAGFYTPQSGSIQINGISTASAGNEQLHKKIGLVPQKAFLFSGTVSENIRYGKRQATAAEVEAAARTAQAHEFIKDLPDQYEALISQEGGNLSGGQKQRLSIARAVVRRPEIYLFDDSFSALDFRTDFNLRKALKQEAMDSIVLMVTQRIHSIEDAEQIIVMDKGFVAGIGTHKELLHNCEIYRQIAKSQLSQKEMEV